MEKRKILFLGETYRADAITWMNGLKKFGDFEIITWQLKTPNKTFLNKIVRSFEYLLAPFSIYHIIRQQHPHMVIAERTTSYGFLAALSGVKPIAIAQQGRTDLWPEKSITNPVKKILQKIAFKRATLIHAWGPIMAEYMIKNNVHLEKILVLPKGINLNQFENKNIAPANKICAIVTRALCPEYRHDVILHSFSLLNKKGYDFTLTIVGDGPELSKLKSLSKDLEIDDKVFFMGHLKNSDIPKLLQQSNFYISMPITEGVSGSLFEAMACGCYPLVTNIAGNQNWIKHRENGQLISVDDSQMLAEELVWAYKNKIITDNAVFRNRKFIETYVDFNTNMKIIADKYHELIDNQKSN